MPSAHYTASYIPCPLPELSVTREKERKLRGRLP